MDVILSRTQGEQEKDKTGGTTERAEKKGARFDQSRALIFTFTFDVEGVYVLFTRDPSSIFIYLSI